MNSIKQVLNVLDAYGKARQRDRRKNRGWYVRAHRWCKQMSEETGYPLHVVVGVLAAISPGVRWKVNKSDARAVLTGDVLHPFATYPVNVSKAWDILGASREVEVLKRLKPRPNSGMKVYAFYHNIRYPLTVGAVTIDRHAISVALGRPLIKGEGSLTPLQYAGYENVYKYAANIVGLKPQQLQAIVWEWWRKGGKAVAENGHEY
jgi:hypothetical protein